MSRNPNETVPMRLYYHQPPGPYHHQQHQHRPMARSTGGSDVPDSPSANSSVSYFSDVGDMTDNRYISRKTVENILNLQRHSHLKTGSRNSASSIESFDIRNGNLVFNKPLTALTDKPRMCTLQRNDSGNSSPGYDKGSASSSGEGQYFTFKGTPQRRPFSNLPGHRHPPSPRLSSDQGYDSFSLSSTDSYPSVNSSGSSANASKITANANRLKQIPEDMQLMELINTSTMLDCDKLCSTADVLLLKSHEKEREGDLRAAAALSDSAASKARSAMEAPYSNHQTLISAKMKHSMCVMRSASLHKRLNDIEAEERRRAKEREISAQVVNGHSSHSRQGSRDSTHSKHSRQGSKDSKIEAKDKEQSARHATLDYSNKSRQFVDNSAVVSAGKTLELYATLPKKGSAKKKLFQQSISGLGSLRVKSDDSNIYRDVMNSGGDGLDRKASKGDHKKWLSELGSKSVPNVNNKSKTNVNKSQQIRSESLSRHSSRESDFSDYYSEWEAYRRTQQPSRAQQHRSSSGSASCRENDSEYYGEVGAASVAGSTQSSGTKKQHKVRRKLLMGGLMKRKNRSLPDLREGNDSRTTGASIECRPDESFAEEKQKSSPSLPLLNHNQTNGNHNNNNECRTQITAQIHSQAKGFHQSHRAFCAERGLYQRPSLLKVSPPLIEKTEQIYENTQSIYNSLQKLKTNAKNHTNSNSAVAMNENCVENNQFLTNNQLAGRPPTPPKAKPNNNTVITVAEVHTYASPDTIANKKSENSFLKELTSKRAEIMKNSINNIEKYSDGPQSMQMNAQQIPEQIHHTLPSMPNNGYMCAQNQSLPLPPPPSNLGPTAAVIPKSVLKNSLAKHKAMNDNNYESINSMPITPPHSQPIIACINQMPNSINANKCHSPALPLQTTCSPKPEPQSYDETDGANQKSVRDLTSKFEKIMTTKDIINSNQENSDQCLESTANESAMRQRMDPSLPVNGAHRSVTSMQSNANKCDDLNTGANNAVSKPAIPALEFNKFVNPYNNYQIPSPTALNGPINGLNNCLAPGVRPNRPPDYQTALKRMGLLRNGDNKSALNPQQQPPHPQQQRAFYMNASGNIVHTNCGPRAPVSAPAAQTPPIPSSPMNESTKTMISLEQQKPQIIQNNNNNNTITKTMNGTSSACDEGPSVRPKVRTAQTFKKSVSFSDQVVLVACAQEQEEYLPNPILDNILAKNNMSLETLQSP